MNNNIIASLMVMLSTYAGIAQATSNPPPQTIYYGGDIMTMAGDEPSYAEAVIGRDGRMIDADMVANGTMKLSERQATGSDRDAHGCIGSAGYAWCAKTGRCERPWELARRQGLAAGRAAFDAFCGDAGRQGEKQ